MGRPYARRTRVSQADVAKEAGVSPGVVSAIVNDKSYGSIRISDATKDRVLAVVERLGYVPDPVARRMAGGRNHLIGVFTWEPMFPTRRQSYYHEFLVGIEEAAEALDQNLLLAVGSRQQQRRVLFAGGVNGLRMADGGLLLGAREESAEISRLVKEGYPFVMIGERRFEAIEPSYVAADYVSGTAAVVRHAHRLGHRRIAMVKTHDELIPGRVAGFLDERRRLHLSAATSPLIDLALTVPPESQEVRGARAARAVVASGATAVLLQAGDWWPSFCTEVARLGREIPDDLSVILLRGNHESLDGRPFTELDVPRREMGREAVRLLLELVAQPERDPLRVRLDCGVREGETLVAYRP